MLIGEKDKKKARISVHLTNYNLNKLQTTTAKTKRQRRIESLALPNPHEDALDALYLLQHPNEHAAAVLDIEEIESESDESASDRHWSDNDDENDNNDDEDRSDAKAFEELQDFYELNGHFISRFNCRFSLQVYAFITSDLPLNSC